MKGPIAALLGNKTILTAASGMIRDAFLKDGVSAILMTATGDETGDIPGVKVTPMTERFAVLTGEELDEYIAYRKFIEQKEKEEQRYMAADAGMSQSDWDDQQKEVGHGV